MLKYVNTGVVFQEIPDEVTLSINISNCPCRCPGCHSKYLWEDAGEPLTTGELDRLIGEYGKDITCVCLMGGDADPSYVSLLAVHVRHAHPGLKVAWYSGRTCFPARARREDFDYIKIGPYIEHLGSLRSPRTNQRLMKRTGDGGFVDITSRFWKG